jgi:hypothetical protein
MKIGIMGQNFSNGAHAVPIKINSTVAGMVRLSNPLPLKDSAAVAIRAIIKEKEMIDGIFTSPEAKKTNKHPLTKDAVTKKAIEPITVLVSLPMVYCPFGNALPIKAAIGSHNANIKMGR